ncbi:hypothetical protein ACO0K2_04275 [Undibacterium sp. MH2W]|uniref:hypothetical protein n=1 Tax=Undibacterium sp. MH2W TaxID=3413044 RepID=UPI003BF06F50
MAKNYGPRQGSAAHIAICRIVELGGQATFSQIMAHLKPEQQPIKAFRSQVVIPLQDLCYVHIIGGLSFKATSMGKEYAAHYISHLLPAPKPYVGTVALGRNYKPTRELNLAKHRAVAPFRPGSDDHLRIPSLMGSTRKLPSGEVIE